MATCRSPTAILAPTQYGPTLQKHRGFFVFDEDDGFNQEFFLFGIVCALAIYNDNIVDIHFPFALYKKVLGEKPNLTDLKELYPSVGNSMDRLKHLIFTVRKFS